MGLITSSEEYVISIQRIEKDDWFYKKILWISDGEDRFSDEELKNCKEIVETIITEKPDYIAMGNLRYINQAKLDESDWLENYAKALLEK